MISRDEAKQLLVSLLPPGSEQLYALANTDVIGGTLYGLAGVVKTALLDRIEQLHAELNPSTMTLDGKIPDWESACGLTNTPIARFGTIDQRRNAVLAVLRTSGSFSYGDIRAIVQPYLLYADPSQIQILEPDRVALRTAHTYTYGTTTTVPAANTRTLGVAVSDNPRVSPAGAHLGINLFGYVGDITLTLTGPDGYQATFPPGTLPPRSVVDQQYDLVALGFAGRAIQGIWTLRVTTNLTLVTVNSWSVFVEGLGNIYGGLIPPIKVGEGKGANLFQFAVAPDGARLGTGYDLQGAAQSLTRWKPAHTVGTVLIPSGVMGASYYAIPNTYSAIPDAAIPGP